MRTLKLNLLLFGLFVFSVAYSQGPPPIQQPNSSQRMTVSQVVGINKITVDYSRPGVKDRKVLGELVPMDQMWRAGANLNTTVTFDKEVTINDKAVPAGTYGLHMIPKEGKWTVVLNSDNQSWGSFFYNEAHEVAKFEASVDKGLDKEEWLRFGFDELTTSSANMYLRWADFKVNMPVKTNTIDQMVNYFENEYLKNVAGFFWQGFNNAALYCFNNDVALDKAMTWAEQSISMNKNFSNLSTKSLILRRQGKDAEAKKVMDEAMPLANEVTLNAYGYSLLYTLNDTDGAIKIFAKNIKDYPKSWNVYDSYAEALSVKGNKKDAIKNYEKAMSMAPDNQKQRIEGIIKNLKS